MRTRRVSPSMTTRGRMVRTSRPRSRSSAAAADRAPSKSSRFFTVGLRSGSSPRAFASSASRGASHRGAGLLSGRHRGREKPRVEAERLRLGRDPVGEVDEPVGREREALDPEHLPEGPMIVLAGATVVFAAPVIEAGRPAVLRVGEQDAHLLEGLANDADPVTERLVRQRVEPERARRADRVEAPAPRRGAVRSVGGLDLAPGKHEIAGGELARAMAADQENVERARGAITKQHERGSRHRRRRRRFDGHEVVCHDDRGAVIRFVTVEERLR